MDALTNLPNRLAYDARLEREFARWKRHKNPLTLLVLDVDRFKQINDTYGHKAGDKALKLFAFLLKQTRAGNRLRRTLWWRRVCRHSR